MYISYIYKYKYLYVRYTRIAALVSTSYGVATVSRIDKIIGLFLQNIVSFIGLFYKRDLRFEGAYKS